MRRGWVLAGLVLCFAGEARAQTPIACGEDVQGEISAASEVDSFSFPGASGDAVSVAFGVVQTTSGTFDPVWEVRSPGDVLVDSGIAERHFTLPDNGTYTIRISDQGANGTGRFGLSLQGVSQGATCGDPLDCGQTGSGDLVGSGDSDAFHFEGLAGEVVSITLGHAAAPSFAPIYKVVSPSGSWLGSGTDPFAFALAESGAYTVLVIHQALGAAGAYAVTVQFVSEGAACGAPLACGGYASQALVARGDTDTFAFSGVPGDVFWITLGRASGESGFEPTLRVFSPGGLLLSTAIGVRVMEAGTHTLEVYDRGNDSTGSYGVSLQGVSESSVCGPLASCEPASEGSLLPGDSDAFRLPANAGETFRIVAESISGSISPYTAFFRPDGMLSGRNASVSGIYTVAVYGAGGSYALEVCECPDSDSDGICDDVDCAPDSDGDNVCDAADNCPFVANANQLDTGGIGTSTPDGIGNACQCGDVKNGGIVNGSDGTFIVRHALGYNDPTFQNGGNCDVTGNGECNGQDGVFVTRAGLGYLDPLSVSPRGQNCHNANPAAPPCPTCEPCPSGTCD